LLRPEDYKPYPDDGLGYGDYPDLGNVSTDMKSNWEDWDDPYGKRNFGDAVRSFL
jgi:NADH dehydrogenase (ubiquinone) 1 beta subcomplex subunit 8